MWEAVFSMRFIPIVTLYNNTGTVRRTKKGTYIEFYNNQIFIFITVQAFVLEMKSV